MVAILTGVALAAVLVGAARSVGFDGDPAFYPVVLIVIALLYVLFAVEDGRPQTVAWEIAVAAVFVAASVLGYKQTAWWLVAGYALHGGYDVLHGGVPANSGVPAWWGEFCLGVDGAVAVYLVGYARRPPRGVAGPSAPPPSAGDWP